MTGPIRLIMVTVSMSFDFEKAFDKVPHTKPVEQLSAAGLHPVVNWVKSFLSRRVFRVNYKRRLSSAVVASSGVPQSSATLLFFSTYTQEKLFPLSIDSGIL